MLNTDRCNLQNLVIHHVGNKADEEGVRLSKEALVIQDENVQSLVMKYFLSPFKKPEYYHLYHDNGMEHNELFQLAEKIFSDPDSLFLQSIKIAYNLHEYSTHPMIKAGELYCAYLQDCVVDDEYVDAIGLFKSETKDTYLKIANTKDAYELSSDMGININKLDKGCLILNIDKEKGYRVCIVDTTSRQEEAHYWKNEFIKVKSREDNFYHTQQYMQLCKGFIDDKLKEDFVISKTDEIDLMNRSAKFFKENEAFDVNVFKQEVIQQPEVIDAFKAYKDSYQQTHDITIADEFVISHNAVKTNSRIFKSILKLDKNFSVYIHGKKEYIEKGYDEEKGMNYYQLFYKEER